VQACGQLAGAPAHPAKRCGRLLGISGRAANSAGRWPLCRVSDAGQW